jgi:hypothetical protein
MYSILLCQNSSVTPLELIESRFFSHHPSFYELEILNQSSVKSYMVGVEVRLYRRSIEYLQKISNSLESPPDQGLGAKEKHASKKATKGFITRQTVYEPLRASALARDPSGCFDPYPTVPLSLSAIPSQLKVAAPQHIHQLQEQAKGKKGKKGDKGQK